MVVDEEHDPAYKQDEGVTYHASDMAVAPKQASARWMKVFAFDM